MPKQPIVAEQRLASMALFRGLASDYLSLLNDLLHQTIYPNGATVMSENQPGEAIFFVLQGTVKIAMTTPNGEEVILAILGAGEPVGELSAVQHVGRSATVTALERSTLLWMHRADFQAVLKDVPGIAQNLVLILARRLRLTNAQLTAYAAKDIYARVARLLVTYAQEHGEPTEAGFICIPLRLSQSDLASLCGVSRPRVNQVLSTYRQAGFLVTDDRRYLIIKDLDALVRKCV